MANGDTGEEGMPRVITGGMEGVVMSGRNVPFSCLEVECSHRL